MKLFLLLFAITSTFAADPIAIGSRRELFVDDFLIERLTGKAEQRLHHPQPQEIAITHDLPWEGSGSGYHSIFKDGDKYRMYYKSWQLTVTAPGKVNTGEHPLFTCYAESDDGIHWRKPELGLHEFKGSKANNVVIPHGKMGKVNPDGGHPAVFKDENPNATADARYKAIVRSNSPKGLLALKSPDGLRWTPMADAPVITDGAFDSQNLAFWDAQAGLYRAYWRYFTEGTTDEKNWKPSGLRAIRTATSKDFIHWENQQDLRYVDSPGEALYTNQVKPYHRAPQVLIGFPTRYLERPGTWNYGHQYIAWHPVETKSALEGAPNELSLYATESYWTGNSSQLRRYTLRLDGFVSIHAPMIGGELITKPITFTGKKLAINFATSAAGGVKVEIQDANGKPIPGFALSDSEEHFGDSLERTVVWKNGTDVSSLARKTVRLRFALKDADLYSIKFE